MYMFRAFSKKAIRIVPILLAIAIVAFFGGPFWKATSVTMALISAEIIWLFVITKRHYKGEEDNEGGEPLTKSQPVRMSIVKDFAERYGIGLSQEQTDLIVRASYSSPEWEREIQMMTREYDVVNQWYVHGKTQWLHLYLKAFRNVSITSDFEMQKQIALKAFSVIMAEPFRDYPRISDCVEYVNQKYSTVFDEISFMLTCKYMKGQGYDVKLPEGIVIGARSEVDELIQRWDSRSGAATKKNPELNRTLAQGREAIQRIKESNVLIAGEDMSGKLSRLEKVLGQIFGAVEKHPEKLDDVQRFVNYYLPPILKAVETYKEFEMQKIQGASAVKTKKEIEDNLDSINSALENLATKLYESASMDVSVDLSVLNTLMAKDGLKEEKLRS